MDRSSSQGSFDFSFDVNAQLAGSRLAPLPEHSAVDDATGRSPRTTRETGLSLFFLQVTRPLRKKNATSLKMIGSAAGMDAFHRQGVCLCTVTTAGCGTARAHWVVTVRDTTDGRRR